MRALADIATPQRRTIDLVREVPEAKRPRSIKIESASAPPAAKESKKVDSKVAV